MKKLDPLLIDALYLAVAVLPASYLVVSSALNVEGLVLVLALVFGCLLPFFVAMRMDRARTFPTDPQTGMRWCFVVCSVVLVYLGVAVSSWPLMVQCIPAHVEIDGVRHPVMPITRLLVAFVVTVVLGSLITRTYFRWSRHLWKRLTEAPPAEGA